VEGIEEVKRSGLTLKEGILEEYMAPIIDPDNCTGCGICVEVCASDVLHREAEGSVPFARYPDECWHCAACVMECPVEGAIDLRIPLTHMLLYK
jgi:adenylylsulfate reductase subunit B